MNKPAEKLNTVKQTESEFSRLPVVEDVLDSVFRPVEPRPDFISSLQTRLSDPKSYQPYRALSKRDIILIVITLSSIFIAAVTLIKLLIDFIVSFVKSDKSGN